jgi:hypothetical protein
VSWTAIRVGRRLPKDCNAEVRKTPPDSNDVREVDEVNRRKNLGYPIGILELLTETLCSITLKDRIELNEMKL